jgi:pilus assembly protein CpaF
MSRLQQGISKLNSLSAQGGSTGMSRLSSPSFGGVGHGQGGKNFEELKRQIHSKLVERLDLSRVKDLASDAMRRDIRRAIEHLCDTENPLLNRIEREKLIEEILDETLGFGPLEPLLKDPTVSEVMVNGAKKIYVERRGKIEKSEVTFRDNDHLLQIIDRIVSKVGRRVDETSPLCDARLPDGSRVNAVIPPIALDGASLSIRRFGATPLKLEDLLNYKAFTPEMAMLLEGAIKARLNVLISGGTGSGKTTLLNTLSAFIPGDERLVTIEDAAELQLQQDHVVRLETRPPNIEGKGAITCRDLVKNALRMRPDRIIVGECRGAEALDMLQAMNTGHDGSMTTVHANDTRDALARLEMMVGMAGFDMPIWIIRRQISSAVQVVVQAARLLGGARKIVKISEITGMEGDTISMHDIFAFKQTGVDSRGVAQGYFHATGIRPKCLERLEASGCGLPIEMFERRTLTP